MRRLVLDDCLGVHDPVAIDGIKEVAGLHSRLGCGGTRGDRYDCESGHILLLVDSAQLEAHLLRLVVHPNADSGIAAGANALERGELFWLVKLAVDVSKPDDHAANSSAQELIVGWNLIDESSLE